MTTMNPFVSILIPTKNVAPYINAVLASIFNLDYPKDLFEVVILDGYSDDGTIAIAEKYPVIIHQGHWNVPAFYNRILKDLHGEIIAFGDGDAIVDPQWLQKLTPYFSDPSTGGAGGLCLTANPEHIVPRVIGYELKARYSRMPGSISRIATMNVLYRKSALLRVGGFDERYDTGYDADIGHRVRKAGYTIRFDTGALVYHYNRPTLKSYFRQQFIYGKNAARMYLHHLNIAAGDEVTPLWMNIQPFIYTLIAALFLMAVLIPVAGLIGLFFLFSLFISYLIASVRLAIDEKDISALFFVVLCYVRGIAWTAGGGTFLVSSLVASGKTKTSPGD